MLQDQGSNHTAGIVGKPCPNSGWPGSQTHPGDPGEQESEGQQPLHCVCTRGQTAKPRETGGCDEQSSPQPLHKGGRNDWCSMSPFLTSELCSPWSLLPHGNAQNQELSMGLLLPFQIAGHLVLRHNRGLWVCRGPRNFPEGPSTGASASKKAGKKGKHNCSIAL